MKRNILTKEEKLFIRSYLKMCIAKNWYKPTEFEISQLIDKMTYEERTEIQIFIDKEYNKLINS